MPKAEKKKRRKRKRLPRVPVESYFCTHCNKEHFKGLVSKLRFAKHYVMFRKKEEGKLLSKEEVITKPLPKVKFEGKLTELDSHKRSKEVLDAHNFLRSKIVGQDHAVDRFTNLIAKIEADICDPYKPRGTYLFLGPTGVGKTRLTEALAEYFFHSRKKMVKINCGEMATMFSFKKFGARLFYDDNIALRTRSGKQLGLILLDEIEKATILLYKILLGVLDRASMTIDDQEVDLSHTVVVMTSNLGSKQIMEVLSKHRRTIEKSEGKIDHEIHKEMHKQAVHAATERFSPEFFNRLDDVVVFNPLLKEQLHQIVAMEIENVEQRLVAHDIRIKCMDHATDYLLKEGTDIRYGARHLRRALERLVVQPIAHMITTGQLKQHSRVKILFQDGKLHFRKVTK